MNTSHTAGPWIISEEGINDIIILGGKYEEFICSPSGANYGELVDNARLIAAAPDMLDALRTALMCIYGYTHRNAVIDNAIEKINQAINKATGQQPAAQSP